MKKKTKLTPYLYVIPGLLMVLGFVYIPIIVNLVYSFFRLSSYSSSMKFVGLDNFRRLFTNDTFPIMIRNNVYYCVISLIVQVGFGTFLAFLLESRLDNVLFRMGFGRTRKETRQIVDHKHVLVNGKQVNIPSYQVKAGDVIEIKEKFKSAQRYKDILEVTAGRMVPAWLESDQENLRGTVKELPTRDEIDVPVNEMLIVELYSK